MNSLLLVHSDDKNFLCSHASASQRIAMANTYRLYLYFSIILCAKSLSFQRYSSLNTAQTATRKSAQAMDESEISPESCLRNFRAAPGLSNSVYRCAKTDNLADRIEAENNLSSDELVVLHEVGLIVDLRSDSERNEKKAIAWMERAPGGAIIVQTAKYTPTRNRTVLRLDPLSPPEFMEYLEKKWMSPELQLKAKWYKIISGDKLHELRMNVFNQKGLAGLNEAILETGKDSLREALQAITLHLEQRDSPVVVHCVQGKDRTGLVIMLCQSIMGCSDEMIISDYHRSEQELLSEASAAASKTVGAAQPGKVDKRFFSGAPREAMEATLLYIRTTYGSVEGYLDVIGVDADWRQRLQTAVLLGASKKTATSRL